MEEDQEEFLYTIIGVVGSIRQNDLTEAEQNGSYYFTYKQRPRTSMTLTVRTAVEPITLTAPIRQAVVRIDSDLPFYHSETLAHRVSESLLTRRTPMVLLAGFAGVALLLATAGIYGVLAYSVTQRTRELGIRMALGSSPAKVSRLVVLQGVKVLGLGLVIGLGGSVLLMRLIQSLLYGVQPTDPTVLLSVAAVLITVGIGACLLPARRATRIDPTVALPYELGPRINAEEGGFTRISRFSLLVNLEATRPFCPTHAPARNEGTRLCSGQRFRSQMISGPPPSQSELADPSSGT